jgi:transcriptional regulator with XRE-family HTH domain
MSLQQMKTIRAKKLGVLMRDAREASGKNIRECADALGITPATFRSYERGAKSPSLPEIEVYAYFLEVPLEHFWGSTAISEQPPSISKLDVGNLLAVRQEAIAHLLEKSRTEANRSLKEVAKTAGISPRRLKTFETGAQPVPLPELESILNGLDQSLEDVMDQEGPVREWQADQEAIQQFLELPAEMQAFVCKPINRPFLEVAQRLSQMPVDQLRSVAEGLLEITF